MIQLTKAELEQLLDEADYSSRQIRNAIYDSLQHVIRRVAGYYYWPMRKDTEHRHIIIVLNEIQRLRGKLRT